MTHLISQTLGGLPTRHGDATVASNCCINSGLLSSTLAHSPNTHSTCLVFTSAGVMWTMALHGTGFWRRRRTGLWVLQLYFNGNGNDYQPCSHSGIWLLPWLMAGSHSRSRVCCSLLGSQSSCWWTAVYTPHLCQIRTANTPHTHHQCVLKGQSILARISQ